MSARVSTTSRSRTIQKRMQSIGTATYLLTRCRYQVYAAACIRIWLEPAIDFEQIRFYFDAAGKPVGYVTWAWLAKDVAARLVRDPAFALHISEWTEGEELWILDFVAPFGDALDIAADCLQADVFARAKEVNFVRRNQDGSVRRVGRVKRRKRSSPEKS